MRKVEIHESNVLDEYRNAKLNNYQTMLQRAALVVKAYPPPWSKVMPYSLPVVDAAIRSYFTAELQNIVEVVERSPGHVAYAFYPQEGHTAIFSREERTQMEQILAHARGPNTSVTSLSLRLRLTGLLTQDVYDKPPYQKGDEWKCDHVVVQLVAWKDNFTLVHFDSQTHDLPLRKERLFILFVAALDYITLLQEEFSPDIKTNEQQTTSTPGEPAKEGESPTADQVIEKYYRRHARNPAITLKQVCEEMGVSYGYIRKRKVGYDKRRRRGNRGNTG